MLVSLGLVALAGELWLRIDYRNSERASRAFSEANVFFARNRELNAAGPSLWLKVWRKYRPGARSEIEVGGERFVVEINSRGYRTPEFSVPKPAGLVRVACIGGSTTVAGRTNRETYPALLEALLRERHPGLPIEVLNLGISGTTSERWRERLPHVLGFEPDVVVDYEGINDICWIHLDRYAREHPLRRRLHGSLLFERLLPLRATEIEPYMDPSLETLTAIASECRSRQVGYLLGSFAGPDAARASGAFRRHLDVNLAYWTPHLPLRSYATYQAILGRYNARLLELARRRHLALVPVHARLSDPDLFIDACHFTPEGIRLLAEAFLPGVEALIRDAPGYRAWKARPASSPAG